MDKRGTPRIHPAKDAGDIQPLSDFLGRQEASEADRGDQRGDQAGLREQEGASRGSSIARLGLQLLGFARPSGAEEYQRCAFAEESLTPQDLRTQWGEARFLQGRRDQPGRAIDKHHLFQIVWAMSNPLPFGACRQRPISRRP